MRQSVRSLRLPRCALSVPAMAQQTPHPPKSPAGRRVVRRPRRRMKMAPVPAFPIPTAADQLPTKKFKLPPGFKVETWASGVLDARGLRQGDKGNIFVSTLFVGNKVYVDSREGQARAQGDHRQDAAGHRHRVPQGQPVLRDQHEDRALRQHRGQARQASASPRCCTTSCPAATTTAGSTCASTTTSCTSRSARRATSAIRASTRRSTA